MTGAKRGAARRRAALAPIPAVLAGTALLALTACGPAHTARHDATGRPVAAPTASSSPEETPSLIPKGHPVGAARAGTGGGSAGTGSGSARTGSGLPLADPCAHNHHCYVPPAPIPTPDWTRATEPTKPGDLPPNVPTITGAPVG